MERSERDYLMLVLNGEYREGRDYIKKQTSNTLVNAASEGRIDVLMLYPNKDRINVSDLNLAIDQAVKNNMTMCLGYLLCFKQNVIQRPIPELPLEIYPIIAEQGGLDVFKRLSLSNRDVHDAIAPIGERLKMIPNPIIIDTLGSHVSPGFIERYKIRPYDLFRNNNFTGRTIYMFYIDDTREFYDIQYRGNYYSSLKLDRMVDPHVWDGLIKDELHFFIDEPEEDDNGLLQENVSVSNDLAIRSLKTLRSTGLPHDTSEYDDVVLWKGEIELRGKKYVLYCFSGRPEDPNQDILSMYTEMTNSYEDMATNPIYSVNKRSKYNSKDVIWVDFQY